MTTDTHADLDAAIDTLITIRADAIAGTHVDLAAERAARKAIDRAIAAHVEAEVATRTAALRRDLDEARGLRHVVCDRCGEPIQIYAPGRVSCPCVEAEVARRLEAAPDVEQWLGGIASRALRGCSDNDARADLLAQVASLRAAIAADRVRAAAEDRPPLDPSIRADLSMAGDLLGCEPPQDNSPMFTWVGYAGQVRLAVEMVCLEVKHLGKARPTPDEARRLVEEFERACDAWQYRDAEARTAARAALLRALGVEA